MAISCPNSPGTAPMSQSSCRKKRTARKTHTGRRRLTKDEQKALKAKRRAAFTDIKQQIAATGSGIITRTQACNRKCSAESFQEEQAAYEDIVSAQMDTWRSILPGLIKKFANIKDPRNPKTIRHSMTVLMLFGLFHFLFMLKSRRAFNENLTTPSLCALLEEFFPDMSTIPHADTLARLLERMDVDELERAHIDLIRKLIKRKKFIQLLVRRCLPISIDGTQKAVRNGQLQEGGWLLRTITKKSGKEDQQYIYVLEANITFANGLSIPLLTEYCRLDAESYSHAAAKQDCELKAFYRLTERLKAYFPRLNIMILLDALYACHNVIAYLQEKHWKFMIKLPKKLKLLNEVLDKLRDSAIGISSQPYWRERKQKFYWINHVNDKGCQVHLVGCMENWLDMCKETGKKIMIFSQHTWISSDPLSIKNVHEYCNLGARTRVHIEDNFNTEKNRGYQYEHIFSYHWNGMKGFHALMRLAHAINAISEFTKKLKKYIKAFGISNTLTRIFEAIKHPWLSNEWVKKECQKTAQIRFDFKLEVT